MLVIGGMLVVTAAVIGSFLWEGGKIGLLIQPAEFAIIGGSALGTLLVSTPMGVLHELMNQLKRLMTPPPGRKDYADLLVMLYQLFRVAQSTGVMALEPHLDNPEQSSVLSKYPKFLARKLSMAFLADSARVIIIGGISSHDFDQLMYEDLEIRHRESTMPAATLTKIGDALPGLGIVAAVLGVVLTMQAIDGPVVEIGHKVGAALVGTFLGILLSYGFVQPLAANLEHRVTQELNIEQAITAIAVEFARRVIPDEDRPSFEETEQLCRGARSEAQAVAA
jgi:chemotaxis protein MotA